MLINLNIILLHNSIGLWELCSKFLSLPYSEFLLKSLHFLNFILLCLWFYHYSPFANKSLNTYFGYIQNFSLLYNITISVSWSLISSKSLTFTASSTVPELEMTQMSLFSIFSLIFFWHFFYSNLLCSIFYSKFHYFAWSLAVLLAA